ncbi:hypothetical protein OVO36_10760, partial [Streptococcus pneumoniae]|nr:hypothetical protein [Streptococcus pneumoniae]
FATLHAQFQEAFSNDGPWREVVNEAVSVVRLSPSAAGGYFLFQVGSELEKANRLHTADLCLATAIELLESGSAFGAACHLAGRV